MLQENANAMLDSVDLSIPKLARNESVVRPPLAPPPQFHPCVGGPSAALRWAFSRPNDADYHANSHDHAQRHQHTHPDTLSHHDAWHDRHAHSYTDRDADPHHDPRLDHHAHSHTDRHDSLSHANPDRYAVRHRHSDADTDSPPCRHADSGAHRDAGSRRVLE